jgi:hypothetical protein
VLLVPRLVRVCACRLPTKVNQALVDSLGPSSSKAAALKAAQKLAAVYQYNKCTPDVWQHLVDAVQQQGSLAGMLQLKAGPLAHSGYRLAAPADGCDLEHIGLTGVMAPQLVAQLVLQVHEGGQQLWGALPEAPSRPMLLQCAPDLLCADWEQMQQALAALMLQQGNALQAGATAVAAAAAAVAAATGRGEDQAAASAAAAAAGAAAAAVSVAQAMGSASTPQPSLAPAETEAAATEAAAAPAAATEATSVPAADYGGEALAAAATAAAAADYYEELLAAALMLVTAACQSLSL